MLNVATPPAIEQSMPSRQVLKRPEWIEKSIIYSVFPRNFSKTGDLPGVTAGLEHVKELGADIVWLLPIHPISVSHKKGSVGSPYAIVDYTKINPAYGTVQDLKDLVTKAHALELKVIIDAVLNHTAWDSVLMEFPEFYLQDINQRIISPQPSWSDVAALNYNNEALHTHIIDMLKYWLLEYNLDGFRFDASDFVPIAFWKKVSEELQRIKPDILLLGEGKEPEALCVGFHLDYDWKFKGALDSIIMEGAPATQTIQEILEEDEKLFPPGAIHLRFIDNHDERRAIARYGEKATLAASALIFTVSGVPLIYNGMEVGDTAESCDPALFETLPIFWGADQIRPAFKGFFSQIITQRKRHPALWKGRLKWLPNAYEERALTFLRETEEETLFVAINLSNQPCPHLIDLKDRTVSLKAWEFAIFSSDSTSLEDLLADRTP